LALVTTEQLRNCKP